MNNTKTKRKSKALFTADQFTPTAWDTAEDKAKFANFFVSFIDAGCPAIRFQKRFYDRLMNTHGHIAHYDRGGFFDVWFATPEKIAKFIGYWIEQPACGSPEYTFSDVERELQSWLVINRERLLAELSQRSGTEQLAASKAADSETSRKLLLTGKEIQKFVVASKSANTNSFGLNQFFLVSRDGSVLRTHRTCTLPWKVGQVLSFRLDANRNPVLESCEMSARLKDAPQEIIDAVWKDTQDSA